MSMLRTADAVASNPWQFCLVCDEKQIFANVQQFRRHLRQAHCSKEGGSFVCHYGKHGVCQSLPLEGVNSKDYENHVEKVHIYLNGRVEPGQIESGESKSMVVKPKIPKFKVDDVKTWTRASSQNLSSVLNDPRRHGRQAYLFTKLWGENFVPQDVVPLTLLPNIPKKYFDGYVKRMEFKFMAHQKLKRATTQHIELLSPTLYPGDVGFKSAATSAARQQDGVSDDFDTIPDLFLHANFSLENPTTFDKVLPWSSVNGGRKETTARPMSPKKSRKLLQEKLTHYLDLTEVRLAQQIASRSDDFFRTMSSHEKLQDDVSRTCADVRHLRMQMTKTEEILIKRTLNVMRMFRLRSRYIAVQEKLKLMATIHQTQPTIQILLSTSDYISALDLIDTSLEILQQELAGVQCFRHLGSQLSEMKNVIERMMEADFVDFAIANLNAPSKSEADGLYEEERLLSVVLGLLRQKRFRFLQVYKDEVYSIVKSSIKEEVHSSLYDQNQQSDNEDENPKVGEALRAITHQEWVDLMEKVFKISLEILTIIKLIHESLLKVLTVAVGHKLDDIDNSSGDLEGNGSTQNGDAATLITTSEYNRLSSESKELLWSACELAQIRCSKLISIRSKGGALDQLSSNEFVLLARVVESFVTDCEKVCGRQSHNLRGTLLSQAKRFVEKFHEERKHKLGLILDNERWKQADVPTEFQTLVDSISNGIEPSSSPKQPKKAQSKSTKAPSYLVIQDQRFVIVGTLLLVIKMIVEYCQCVDDAPMLTAEILTKLCEILKSYNSRVCQLVLGAGALKTVGLKTITAKHLGLAAQCLEVIIIHIPIFKSHFEVRVPPKQYVLLSQFDQILKDYRNHRHEIICKLVNLMEEVFNAHLEKYEARPPMPSSGMRAIVKQILKLHETLASVFQEEQMEAIFREIRRSFKNTLAEKLATIGIINDGSPQSGLVTSDMAFFAESVKQCPGMNDIGRKFDDIWTTVREVRKRKLNEIDNKLPKR